MSNVKPTSVAASVAKLAAEQKAAQESEDRKAVKSEIPAGRVLVRLLRPAYDSRGVLHSNEEPSLMLPADVPSSAKVLALGAGVAEDDLPVGWRTEQERLKKLAHDREVEQMNMRKKVSAPVEDDEDDK